MTEQRNTIRTFALCCVAVTSLFIMGLVIWLTQLLSQPDWCDRAIGASKTAAGGTRPEYSVGGCFSLLNQQVQALAWNSHIAIGVVALSLLVLVVIVLAGGQLSFKGGKDGIEANISGEPDEAAQFVADKAQVAADVVKGKTDEDPK